MDEPSDGSNHHNITSNDVDPETINKLRGDAIGDTAYSQVFAIKTVLLLQDDLKWSESMENDLCFLWDMTEEKQVCDYLTKEIDFIPIAISALVKHDNERLVEILFGILGNLVSHDSLSESERAEDLIQASLGYLDSEDHLILIQIMRLLHALAFKSLITQTDRLFEKISFILANSINDDLLNQTLKTVATMTTELSKVKVDVTVIAESTVSAFQTLKQHGDFATSIKYFLQTISNVCVYLDKHPGDSFEQTVVLVGSEIISLLIYCSENSEHLNLYTLEVIVYIFKVLSLEYSLDTTRAVCTLIDCTIKDEGDQDLLKLLTELFCYLISRSSNIDKDLLSIPEDHRKELWDIVSSPKLKLSSSVCEEFHDSLTYFVNCITAVI